MAHRLHIEPVVSASLLSGGPSPGEITSEYPTDDDGAILVEDYAEAEDLVNRVAFVHWDDPNAAKRQTDYERVTVGEDGSVDEGDDEQDAEQDDEGDSFNAGAFVDRTPMSDVVDDIASGEYDDYLEAISAAEADGDERVGVAEAVTARQEE